METMRDVAEIMPVYAVRASVMVLPGTGQTKAHRVVRIFAGGIEGPCAAVFAHGKDGMGKTYAEQYAEYLTRNRIEVV